MEGGGAEKERHEDPVCSRCQGMWNSSGHFQQSSFSVVGGGRYRSFWPGLHI